MKNITRLFAVLMGFIILVSPVMGISPSVVPAEEANTTPVSLKDAASEFKSLSKKEQKERLKEVKKVMKDYKAQKKAGKEPSTNTLLLVILAILLPPLAVYLHQGVINNKFWIALVLTLLFWLPGVIYALIVILGNG